jgi:hypothetical protein
MKNIPSFKTLILAAAVAAGLSSLAFADEPALAPAPAIPPGSHGLLGQNYANLGYHYTDYSDTSISSDSYEFAVNQAIHTGLDTLFEYEHTRSSDTAVGHVTQDWIDIGARAYTNFYGFKPYFEAGLGWAWQHAPITGNDDSFVWFTGVGAEFLLGRNFSLTPLVRYSYACSFDTHGEWDYGLKANYWLTEKVGLQVSVLRDNTRDMSYGAGVNVRF